LGVQRFLGLLQNASGFGNNVLKKRNINFKIKFDNEAEKLKGIK